MFYYGLKNAITLQNLVPEIYNKSKELKTTFAYQFLFKFVNFTFQK